VWQWDIDADRIKSVIKRCKKRLRDQDFGAQYRPEMDRTNGFSVCSAHPYWATFVLALKTSCLSSLERQEAKNQLNAEKYSGDIKDYILKMKWLNNLMGMSGET
jgi:hypothetical protein